MTGLHDDADRVHEATPARRRQAVEQGLGPRAPWLASAVAGLLALGLLSIAAGPVASGARVWLRHSLSVAPEPSPVSAASVLMPAIVCVLAVCLAVLAASLLVQGPWIRLAVPSRARKAGWSGILGRSVAGWVLGASVIAAGAVAAMPWLPGVARLAARGLQDGLWAAGAFAAAVAIAALLAVVAMGLLQWWLASRRFDRMLRMTRAEAREAAKDDRRRPAPARWRLA